MSSQKDWCNLDHTREINFITISVWYFPEIILFSVLSAALIQIEWIWWWVWIPFINFFKTVHKKITLSKEISNTSNKGKTGWFVQNSNVTFRLLLQSLLLSVSWRWPKSPNLINYCFLEQVKNFHSSCSFYSTQFNILGDVQGGFPSVGLPPFSSTLNDTSFTFIDMMGVYGSSLAFCPLIAFLEHIAIVKAFST